MRSATVMRPLIGITPTPSTDELSHGTFPRYVLNMAYANAVAAAGGIPVILPYTLAGVAALVGRLDGLLFSGGADLDPALYGDTEVHPTTYEVSPARDAFELALLDAALAQEMPLLCICRGIQVLNVGLGGTLYQDIPAQFGDAVQHRQQRAGVPADLPGHDVQLTPGSILASAAGAETLPVNSFHHQNIKDLAPGLDAIAVAPDGLIEAVDLPGHPFVLGVQWHPELMFDTTPAQAIPFNLLVAAARAHAHAIPATLA